jgi:hypothetical protein
VNIIAAALPIVGLIIYFSFQNWQKAVKMALILAVLEGILRKWVLPQASQLIYFLKDFVLFGAYLRYFFFAKGVPKLVARYNFLSVLLVLTLIWCLPQIWNPSLGSPIIGFLGLKNYFFYVPLMWMLPSLFRTEEELHQFLRTYLLLLIPVGMLAIAQFFAPPESPLNMYAWGEEGPDVAIGGNNTVRVTGTFSYIAGYTTYLNFCLALLIPLLSLNQPGLWQWAIIGEFLLIAITSFMTGARGLISGSVLFLAGYFAIQGIGSLKSFYRSLQKLVLPTTISVLLINWKFRAAVDAFWVRVTSNTDMADRFSGTFTEPFANFKFKEFDGYGIGSTFQAGGIIRKLLELPPGEIIPVYFEAEPGRIALEIGPLGFFLWYGIKLVILIIQWNLYQKLKNSLLRQLALSIFLIQAINFTGQIVFNHTANIYYWFLNGFIFLLPQLDRTIAQRTPPEAL